MPSQGPNSPSTVADDSSIGSVAWSNPGNATTSDDSRATASIRSQSGPSHYLKATDFGFSIPSGATIDGIEVEVEKGSNANNQVADNAVRIVKGGTIGSTDKSGANWATTDAYITHGGASDLWGKTWTPTDINNSNFGFAISASCGAPVFRDGYIDHIRITVHYTEGAGGGFEPAWAMGISKVIL